MNSLYKSLTTVRNIHVLVVRENNPSHGSVNKHINTAWLRQVTITELSTYIVLNLVHKMSFITKCTMDNGYCNRRMDFLCERNEGNPPLI